VLIAAVLLALVMADVWAVARRIRNAGIVDIAWSANFSVLALLYAGYVFVASRMAPAAAPGLPAEAIGFREEGGGRGLGSLPLLAAASALASGWLMRASSYTGADRVILSLAAAIAVAFAVAATDWLLELATGRRLLSRLARQVTFVMVPPLLLIFLVLGTIFIGLATPTEGGAMGALGALLLAFARRVVDGTPKWFNLALVRSAAEATARLSAFVLFILIGARIFSLTFYGINGHLWVERLFTSLPGGEVGFLVVVNVLVFVLAFFLDFFELAFIVVPLIAPVADRLGIDLVWFGVMLAVNMQTSFMHPPFGFALFFLRSVAPREAFLDKVTGKRTEGVTTGQIYWGAVPFLVIQLARVALVVLFPGLVLREEPIRPAPVGGEVAGRAPRARDGAPLGGFYLPGTPPEIPGAPPIDPQAPPAPVLDLSVPPPSLSNPR
jgi:TRAP-type mannitol/chloroaromatic compound transport system permease large subunit